MLNLARSLFRMFGHLHFIPFGVRDRIIRLFFHPDRMDAGRFEVNFYGYKYAGDFSCFLDWEVFFYGSYEPAILSLLQDVSEIYPKNSVTFVDVGANVGQHTLFMSKLVDRVISVEPFEEVFRWLEEKIVLNKISNVELHKVAIGDIPANLIFNAPVGNNKGTGSFLNYYNPQNNKTELPVNVINGSSFLTGLKITSPIIIKIDVEGFELEVMQGLSTFIFREKPVIVMEFSHVTRQRFCSKNDLMAGLPSNYLIMFIRETKNNYKFVPFNYLSDEGNIIMIDKEVFARHFNT